jgi:hypothetical protein
MGYDCGGCGMGYKAPVSACYSGMGESIQKYSSLEAAVKDSKPEYKPVMMKSEEASAPAPVFNFGSQPPIRARESYNSMVERYTEGMYLNTKANGNYFSPSSFVDSNVPTEFISCLDSQKTEFVKGLVEDAFEAATGKKFPKDIAVRICSEKQMKEMHEANGGVWNPGIRGFSLNRRGFGTSEIFVQEDELASLMLTAGHEVGHVITLPMDSPVDEEAKAFAFSMAWMKAVKDNNIGGLFEAINPMPANNGLHNKAFDFVVGLIRKGREAIDVYLDLIRGDISIRNIVPDY